MTRKQSSLSRVVTCGLIALASSAISLERADAAPLEDSDIIVFADPKPQFPRSLWERGIVTGRATIVVTVNHYGLLEDWLVIEATHRDLEQSIDAVITQWNFQPAVVEGEPVTAVQRVAVFFDISHLLDKGRNSPSHSISSQTRSNYKSKRGGASRLRKQDLKLADVEEIDRYPEIVTQYQPMISTKSLEQSLGSNVTFKFYIDTDGRVRMSTLYKVQGNPDPEAIMATHAALSSWRFKPIRSNGKPVVFEAVQTFEFSSLYAAGE